MVIEKEETEEEFTVYNLLQKHTSVTMSITTL